MGEREHIDVGTVDTDELFPVGGGPCVAGNLVGNYRVLSLLGEGGMGMVYRAEHVRLGRKVAIKVLRRDLVQKKEIVARFFNEARAVNEIHHPNIVDIVDFVENYDEEPPLVYMVMELLRGKDLRTRVHEAAPLDPEEAVAIALQVANALVAVHKVQILHRDLKPDNIFLVEPDESEESPPQRVTVKLLDFGVARAFGERERANVTDPGTAIGTPDYMAPEQVLGRKLDDRTDIYALGMVLYEMLTGSVPFASQSYGEVLVKAVKEQPAAIAARRTSGRPVPLALEALVMRCLEKDPVRRFQSARELRSALLEVAEREMGPDLSRIAPLTARIDRRGETAIISDAAPGGSRAAYLLPLLVLAVSLAALVGWWIMRSGSGTSAVAAAPAASAPAPAAVRAPAGRPKAVTNPASAVAAPRPPAPAPEEAAAASSDEARRTASKVPRALRRRTGRGGPTRAARPADTEESHIEAAPRRETPRHAGKKRADISHGTMDPFAP